MKVAGVILTLEGHLECYDHVDTHIHFETDPHTLTHKQNDTQTGALNDSHRKQIKTQAFEAAFEL